MVSGVADVAGEIGHQRSRIGHVARVAVAEPGVGYPQCARVGKGRRPISRGRDPASGHFEGIDVEAGMAAHGEQQAAGVRRSVARDGGRGEQARLAAGALSFAGKALEKSKWALMEPTPAPGRPSARSPAEEWSSCR